MTNRKAVLYRILASVAVVVIAALSWLAFFFARKPARADETAVQSEAQPTHDEVFGANHANSKPFSLSDEEIVYVESSRWFGDDYYLRSSTFHLTEDVVLSSELEMSYSVLEYEGLITDDRIVVNICLHGHSITYSSDNTFKLYGNSTLNIYDCGGDDNHSGSTSGLYIANGAVCNMYGGAAKGYKDSGVTVSGGAVFNMYGGEISGNGTQGTLSGGGGVYVGYTGEFNMYGGTICNNTVKKNDGGGVRVGETSATFHMYGGTITNNTVTFKDDEAQSTVDFYGGAGVYVNGGTFTVEGNVNITGNVKGKPSALSANNVEILRKVNSDGSPIKDYDGNILYDGKIKITGQLGTGSQIGMTMPSDNPTGVITSGYTDSGNTQNPSVFFNCDNSEYSIGYDEDLGKEAAVYEGSVVVGNFVMKNAVVKGEAITPKVGDTSVSLNIEVSLEDADDPSLTKTITDIKTVPCTELHVGSNTISFVYEYKGKSKSLTHTVTLDKVHATVSWTHAGATSTGSGSAEREYDGTNILGNISARYTGYNGTTVTVSGADLIVKNESGATVSSVAAVGVYTITLAPSSVYEFANDTLTLTVNEVVDNGYYKVQSVVAVGSVGTPTVGDTSVKVSVKKTLVHTKTGHEKNETATTQVPLSTALTVGNNEIAFNYKYTDEREGEKTVRLTLSVTAAKKQVTVAWYYNNAVAASNSANRDYDGDDALGLISAKFTGVDGTQKTVSGASSGVIVKNNNVVVNSAVNAGVYTISLAPQADYEFSNNSFTLTVNAVNVDDGYYKVQSVVALGAAGTPTAGDRTVTVSVQKTLVHTKTGEQKTETATTQVTLASALHGGSNKIAFDYKYNDIADGEKTVRLTLTVTAAKKQVSLTWYYNDNIAVDNRADRVYDGTDVSDRIVAEYVGIDGRQRVDGRSALMLKKLNGNAVSSLSAVGVYTLSLADSADYTFGNNLFTYTVVQNLGDISDLTYEEDEEIILGVSSDDGFAAGTEVVVEKVTDLDDSLVDGKISTALNVSFVNDSVEVTPTGTITVRVIIPDELKDGAAYKIYNLNNGVATEVRFTSDGNYATFELSELSTILFVTEESLPIIDPNPTHGGVIKLGGSELLWIWVLLAILSVGVIAVVVTLIVMAKRGKK